MRANYQISLRKHIPNENGVMQLVLFLDFEGKIYRSVRNVTDEKEFWFS